MEWKREVGKTKEEIWRDVPERVEAMRKASSEGVKSHKKSFMSYLTPFKSDSTPQLGFGDRSTLWLVTMGW